MNPTPPQLPSQETFINKRKSRSTRSGQVRCRSSKGDTILQGRQELLGPYH
ncbi:hypothetical protein Sjap_015174 [Stephania japonica]|uniref:Uncharacterized protein n=1 Tax=Stephania japonica TaxID=461633 RepID=A0AAP0NQK9_9MAGN